jgi:hypothetical protein
MAQIFQPCAWSSVTQLTGAALFRRASLPLWLDRKLQVERRMFSAAQLFKCDSLEAFKEAMCPSPDRKN